MEYVYHGSPEANLKIIKRNKSTHMQNWVYATPSKAISTIFLSPLGNDLYYYLAGDGVKYPVELVERKKGMFEKIFNCKGYIYKLNASNFKSGKTGWSAEVVSNKDENVVSSEYIENVYEELKNLAKEKKLKLYLYPNRPDNIPLDNSDLIKKVIKWYKNGFDINKFYELYPELKEQFIKALNDNQ